MPDIEKITPFEFPVNKIGESLLEKSIKSLVEDGFLESTIYAIVDECSKSGLNRNSLLTELVNIRGHQILWEIKNSPNLYYEICRRYQNNENMWFSLCAIWKYMELKDLDINGAQYETINCEVINYTSDINWRLSALDYLVSNQKEENMILKKKLDQFIRERLEIITNTIIKKLHSNLNYSADDLYSCMKSTISITDTLYWILDDVNFLVTEILKSSRFDTSYQKVISKNIPLNDIGGKIHKRLRPFIDRMEMANVTIDNLLSGFLYSQFDYLNKDKKQTIANIKKSFESEINILKPQIKTWVLDSIMESIEKYALINRKTT